MVRSKRGRTSGASSKIANAMPAATKKKGTHGKRKPGTKRKTNAAPRQAKGTTRSQVEQPAVVDRDVETAVENSLGEIKDTTDSCKAMCRVLEGLLRYSNESKAGGVTEYGIRGLMANIFADWKDGAADSQLQNYLRTVTGLVGKVAAELEGRGGRLLDVLEESMIDYDSGKLKKVKEGAVALIKHGKFWYAVSMRLRTKIGGIVEALMAGGVEMVAEDANPWLW